MYFICETYNANIIYDSINNCVFMDRSWQLSSYISYHSTFHLVNKVNLLNSISIPIIRNLWAWLNFIHNYSLLVTIIDWNTNNFILHKFTIITARTVSIFVTFFCPGFFWMHWYFRKFNQGCMSADTCLDNFLVLNIKSQNLQRVTFPP